MQINQAKNKDILIYYIKGDVDINTSPDMRKNFDTVANRQEKKIIINLSGVSYIDSSGLATLVEMLKKVRKYGGKLKLSSLADKVKSLFEITKLEKLFEIYDNEEVAVSEFDKQ